MVRRRSKFEILLKVLTVIKEGETKKTRIMYASALSWKSSKSVLSRLLEYGLISTRKSENGRSRDRYYISGKGVRLLEYFSEGLDEIGVKLLK